MTQTLLPIHRLPLPSKTLQKALTRLEVDGEPSAQRRSTSFPASTPGVWAPVQPLWTEWPLRVTKAEALELGADVDKGDGVDVEDVLRRWDPVDKEEKGDNGLALGSSVHRLKLEPILLGVSEFARAEVLPHLDVGDAADLEAGTEADASPARAALVDVLSGRKILSSAEYGPWATRYCGHQFGQWAGQLGDGRAVSLIETVSEAGRTEIQVKGAGRTPFSRSADGLAVLRSGVREYLGCEAIAALGIPTTRSLAILTSPVIVIRENGRELSSLVARTAPTFIRIGHFEAMNPGEAGRNTHQIFFGGAWNNGRDEEADKKSPLGGHGNLDGLRDLTLWVKDEVMQSKGSIKDWFFDVVRRNADTVAAWQVYGFMHGVLNTDNISIMGLTIDYGPYAFMDVFDPQHICNHSDPGGLYSYRNQPNRVLFALDSLASSLLPILGYEKLNGAPPPAGWGEDASTDDVRKWEEAGLAAIDGWNKEFIKTQEKAESDGWKMRFGLKTFRDDDERAIVRNYQSMLKACSADFGVSFRLLAAFEPSRAAEDGYIPKFAKRFIAATTADLSSDSVMRAEEDAGAWLRVYAARATEDAEVKTWTKEAGDGKWEAARTVAMRKVNPRFILRQWVLEEVIATMDKALKDADVPTARRALALVLDLASNPFETYGEREDGSVRDDLDDATAERARLCGLGPRGMLGFQCSCSS
ncbi:UPF0061-domain-containing protein [Cutaneotrichosporon oleaginosum]|uniref:Selenoprotein O n=1 Tax=Cutaneotrichosporon oleaginosum TaxID=879819 RepID=A0A0J0XWF9_9TREE|nr:UPF0061-domain-containing protein [Cutaneotrichosporon oleaginosum]KLT45391.1 UPF0061-domain-containing protein [Cutaneotrichosporon oleaginosum]TXT14644.1 hypothetical protein COLE_00837 [Cutaneotrichosporon oleaginosum]